MTERAEGTPGFRSWPRSTPSELLESARGAGLLSALDHRFATRLARLYDCQHAGVWWALALASRQEAAGHVCADLPRLAATGLVSEATTESSTFDAVATHDSLDEWLDEIRSSDLVETLSSTARPADECRPLILDAGGRLYLRRAYQAEARLAAAIRERAHASDHEIDWALVDQGMAKWTSGTVAADEAARSALDTVLSRPLAIITGGPGTGKTTMVARVVARLVEQAIDAGAKIPRVRLLAPTGKAAAALTSSFAEQRETHALSDDVRAAMDLTAETVHRALYPQTRRDVFGRAPTWSLEEDLVVVDEASMVDLELMDRLFDACRSVDRIVLLGDPFQLASVDAGAVLSDLCEAPASLGSSTDASTGGVRADARGLPRSVARLTTKHRFTAAGGIDRLAEAIRAGEADAVLEILDDPAHPEVERFEIDGIENVRARLVSLARPLHQKIAEAGASSEKLEQMLQYRILCAHRRGPLGATALCSILDEAAAVERRSWRPAGPAPTASWWQGRMLLVTQNSPDQDLWNGDVGLIEETSSGLRALFPDGKGGVRTLSEGRMPSHESAIAMSVHKSQGSEFEVVDLVLGDVLSRVMTRELVYTGVTRARSKLRIHSSERVLQDAIGRRVSRDSGLRDRIWGD